MPSPAQNQGTGSANVVQNPKPSVGETGQPPKKFPIILALAAVVLLLVFLVLAKYGKGRLPFDLTSKQTPSPQLEQFRSIGTVVEFDAQTQFFIFKETATEKVYRITVDDKTLIVKGQDREKVSFEAITVGSVLGIVGEKSQEEADSISALEIVIQNPQQFLPKVGS